MPQPITTVRNANELLRGKNLIINIVTETGEYRLSDRYTAMAILFPSESQAEIRERIEMRAYYATDLEDAINTAQHFLSPLSL